jgi:short-subunit dehydrogenase
VNKSFALITGASMGIGKALAYEFARHGHDLILVARSADKLSELSKKLTSQFGITTHVISKDLLSLNACEELYNEVSGKNLSVEILVNNAGFGLYGFFSEKTF